MNPQIFYEQKRNEYSNRVDAINRYIDAFNNTNDND